MDIFTLTTHPGYKPPAGATTPDPPVKQRESRLEPFGMCAKDGNGLTAHDRKFLEGLRIKW